jgi:hypothetical protein
MMDPDLPFQYLRIINPCLPGRLCGRLRRSQPPPKKPPRRRPIHPAAAGGSRRRTAAVGCLFFSRSFLCPQQLLPPPPSSSLVFSGSCLFRDPVEDATARVRLCEIRPSAPLLSSGPEDLRSLAPSAARTSAVDVRGNAATTSAYVFLDVSRRICYQFVAVVDAHAGALQGMYAPSWTAMATPLHRVQWQLRRLICRSTRSTETCLRCSFLQ